MQDQQNWLSAGICLVVESYGMYYTHIKILHLMVHFHLEVHFAIIPVEYMSFLFESFLDAGESFHDAEFDVP